MTSVITKSTVRKIGNSYYLHIPVAFIRTGIIQKNKEYEHIIKNIENGQETTRTRMDDV